MRSVTLVLALLGVGGLACGLSSAQVARPSDWPAGLDGPTNWLAMPPAATNAVPPNELFGKPLTNSNWLFLGRDWRAVGQTNLFLGPQHPVTPLAPGLYQSEPYTCLILVLGAHPDDKSVVDPGKTESRMPVIKPEIRLIPRKPEVK